jgi:hypothetical protein
MIVFDLRCRAAGHVFEGWFGSSGDYESQMERGLVQCPLCGTPEVEKAVMAPRLAVKGNRADDMTAAAYADPDKVKSAMAAMAQAQKALLEASDNVGDRFATEARSMHFGEIESRSIHGRTTRAETRGLIEDGVPIAPLPFPVIDPGEAN